MKEIGTSEICSHIQHQVLIQLPRHVFKTRVSKIQARRSIADLVMTEWLILFTVEAPPPVTNSR